MSADALDATDTTHMAAVVDVADVPAAVAEAPALLSQLSFELCAEILLRLPRAKDIGVATQACRTLRDAYHEHEGAVLSAILALPRVQPYCAPDLLWPHNLAHPWAPPPSDIRRYQHAMDTRTSVGVRESCKVGSCCSRSGGAQS